MRNYVRDNLSRGISLSKIEESLVNHGYEKNMAKAILADYQKHANRKGISNNLLAFIVMALMFISVLSNWYILSIAGPRAMTGFASYSNTASGRVTMCINTRPTLDILECPAVVNVSEPYYCKVYSQDSNTNSATANTTLLFSDNTTLFNITKIDEYKGITSNATGDINFTSSYPDDIGQNATSKRYLIALTSSDQSGCSNENQTQLLDLLITKGCSVKATPKINNLDSEYQLDRNINWSKLLDITDEDFEDGFITNISELSHDSFSNFSNCLELNQTNLSIQPRVNHIGLHTLNVSVKDNSSCINDTRWQLVNISVSSLNNVPKYTGAPGALDKVMQEDQIMRNAYDLDKFFSDSDGDCLKYEVWKWPGTFIDVEISPNDDPRSKIDCKRTSCARNHLVTFTPPPNTFGTNRVCFAANDTINISSWICAEITVQNVPEIVEVPPGATITPPSGGGGGGGPTPKAKRCEEKWFCGKWGVCDGSIMSRNCTDLNDCHTSKFKPNETMDCKKIDHCINGIQDSGEQGIDCGNGCPECFTCFDGIMNCHNYENGTLGCEEGIDCGGPCRPCQEEEKIAVTPEEIKNELPAPAIRIYNSYYLIGWIVLIILVIIVLWLLYRHFRKKKKQVKKEEVLKEEGMISKLIKKALSKFKRTEHDASHTQIFDITRKLRQLNNEIGKKENEHIIKELSDAMKAWAKKIGKIDYEVTLEEIKSRNNKMEPFFNKLIETEYSGKNISNAQMKQLINEADKITSSHKKSRRAKVGKAALAIFLLLALTGIFILRPEITGRLVMETSTSDLLLNSSYTGNDIHNLGINDLISGISISGSITKDSIAKVYLGNSSKRVLVFDSQNLGGINVKTDNVKIFDLSKKDIDMKIDYNTGTSWDSDDDGYAETDDIIDITPKQTLFSWNASASKLCTLWQITNADTINTKCYGSIECCNLLDLAPERDSWDDTLFLTYGKDGLIENNIVSGKVIYADYSADVQYPYSDIIESETENISANFESGRFSNMCVDSCAIDGNYENSLLIEVTKGILNIDSVHYSTMETIESQEVLKFRDLPNISLTDGQTYELNIAGYLNKPADIHAYSVANVNITVSGETLTIRPDINFEGSVFTYLIANSSDETAVSDIIEITVSKSKEINEHSTIRVGEPVRWKKIIRQNISSIDLEGTPINLTIKKVEGKIENYLDAANLDIKANGKHIDAGKIKVKSNPLSEQLTVSGNEQIQVEYYTESPTSTEENITINLKRVTVSAVLHYQNVTAFTDINDVPKNAIRLYHLINGSRMNTEFNSFDDDFDGLIDHIEWIVPHLSDEIYEIEIDVLNIQSYPTVGGNWTVSFTTVGTANLTISAINETSYGVSLPDDLAPLELRCGNESLDYGLVGNNAYYENYECNETGYWAVRVLTEGIHNQMFVFGQEIAYANNFASAANGSANLSIWDDTDSNINLRAADLINFYANFSNGLETVNGTCYIKFNLTGNWEAQDMMIYNSAVLPWNYSRTIPYKGTSYFNVLCENETIGAVNVTDSIIISNTPPTINDGGDQVLPMSYGYEDSLFMYNFSANCSDVDLNDVLIYSWDGATVVGIPNFYMNTTTGNLSILKTNGDTETYYPVLLVKDSNDTKAVTTLPITIYAVNDIPVITSPAGFSIPSTFATYNYSYNLHATDEEDIDETTGNLIFNFSISSCYRPLDDTGYETDCSRISGWILNSTTGTFNISQIIRKDVGNYTINFSVKDSDNGIGWKLVNFTIIDINEPPRLYWVCNDSLSAIEGIPFNCSVNATDENHDELTFTARVVGEYNWFIINTSGFVNFTANNSLVGNHTINVTVADLYSNDWILINFTINNSNNPPILTYIPDQIAIVDKQFEYYAHSNDEDFMQPDNTAHYENEELVFGINTSWLGLTKRNETDALISFMPLEESKGTYSIMILVNDSLNVSGNITFNLTIRNNTAPDFNWICNDSRFIIEDILFICYVNATDFEEDTFSFSDNTSWFNLSSSGNVSLVVNDTEVGNWTVNITVTDEWGWVNSILVNFTINDTPEAPVFNLGNLAATENIEFDYELSYNVTDEDNLTPSHESFTYLVNNTFAGRLTLNALTGSLNFTPNSADSLGGVYSINFTVIDKYGLFGYTVINLTVINTNNPPTLEYWCQNVTSTLEDALYTCQILANDSDIELGDVLNYSVDVIGEYDWFRVNISTGLVNFSANNSNVGNHTLNISVSDGEELVWQLLNFTVNNTNDIPLINRIGNLTATAYFSFNYTITAVDDDFWQPYNTLHIENENLTFGINATLFNITKTGYNTAEINLTPTRSQVGNYSILINVTDRNGASSQEIINFSILSYNMPPELQSIPNITIEEGSYFIFDVNVTDLEDGNDSSGKFTYRWNHTLGWFILNETIGIFNFTANSSMVGSHVINITVNDSEGKEDSQIFNITILALNFNPVITEIAPSWDGSTGIINELVPSGTFVDNMVTVYLAENSSQNFNFSVTDPNLDVITGFWYFDGRLAKNSTDSYYTYNINYSQAGQHNITLIVDDGRGGSDRFLWNVSVSDVNRLPIFGARGHNIYNEIKDGNFNAESSERVTDTKSGLVLNDGELQGEYISEAIDIGEIASSFYNPIGYTNISWESIIPNGANVTLLTRVTDSIGSDWGNWSNESTASYTKAGQTILSENKSVIQYRLVLTRDDPGTESPNVTEVKINHLIPNLNMTQGDMMPSWISLNNFFYDPDSDNTITYSFTNVTHSIITFDNVSTLLGIEAPNDWYGTEYLIFAANDSHGIQTSNNVTVTINPKQSMAAIEYIYITRTRMVMRTRTRTVTEPRYLELLAPKHITAFSPDTVVAPIVLKNNGESILNDITLSWQKTSQVVDVWMSKSWFDTLTPGQTANADLFIKWNGTVDEFDIIVNATSGDPEFSDSAIISVTGVAKVENNRSIVKDHIEFVRDLLNNNPECLELTELLNEAQTQFESGNNDQARNTLNFVIEGCRYLITTKKGVETPEPIRIRDGDLYKIISGILLLILFIAIIIIIAVTNRSRRLNR